jgi:hypothetical protein
MVVMHPPLWSDKLVPTAQARPAATPPRPTGWNARVMVVAAPQSKDGYPLLPHRLPGLCPGWSPWPESYHALLGVTMFRRQLARECYREKE